MTDDGAAKEAELLAEIERQWAEADRAAGRVIRPARRALVDRSDDRVPTAPN